MGRIEVTQDAQKAEYDYSQINQKWVTKKVAEFFELVPKAYWKFYFFISFSPPLIKKGTPKRGALDLT